MNGFYIDTRDVLVEQGMFSGRRSLMLELSTWDWERGGMNEGLLNEGLAWDVTKEALSWAVKSLASYGSATAGGVASAAAGAEGIALGPIVDTLLDSWGMIDTVKGAIDTVKDLSSKLTSFSGIVNEVLDAYKQVKENFGKFYETTCKVVGKGLKLLGGGVRKKIRKFARKLKTKVEELTGKIVDAITSSLKFLIPDPTAGSALTVGIKAIISGLLQTPYTSLGKVINKMGKFKSFIVDPEVAPRFANKAVVKFISIADDMEEKFEKAERGAKEKEGMISKVLKVTSPAYFLYSKAKETYKDPKVWALIAQKLDEFKPTIISVTSAITKYVVPALFTLLSVYQSLATGDFLKHTGDKKADDLDQREKSKGDKDSSMKTPYDTDVSIPVATPTRDRTEKTPEKFSDIAKFGKVAEGRSPRGRRSHREISLTEAIFSR
jgi:hypothetical protein